MTVDNFFGHWFTDIDIRRHPDDKRILPTNNSLDIYQYSNAQLKYLPEKSVKTLLETMLYSNKPVYLDADIDRRPNNNDDDNKRSDPNLTYRITLNPFNTKVVTLVPSLLKEEHLVHATSNQNK